MAEQFKNKVVIVTGSSSGIGEAIAISFASQGAHVTLCGRDQDRLKSALDKVVKASGGHQDRFFTVQGDLNDNIIRKQIVDQTVDKFGRLDVLVANAGVTGPKQTVETATDESYNKTFDTNLKSVFFLIQQAVPHLEKSKGNIVNISSNVTSFVYSFATIYSMAKIALDHLTRCLAVDLGSKGIRVNSINPGYVQTNIGRDVDDSVAKFGIQLVELDMEKRPLKEKSLTVEDIAKVVLFIASDAAGFITGERINVDAGRSFGGPIDTFFLKLGRNSLP